MKIFVAKSCSLAYARGKSGFSRKNIPCERRLPMPIGNSGAGHSSRCLRFRHNAIRRESRKNVAMYPAVLAANPDQRHHTSAVIDLRTPAEGGMYGRGLSRVRYQITTQAVKEAVAHRFSPESLRKFRQSPTAPINQIGVNADEEQNLDQPQDHCCKPAVWKKGPNQVHY